MADFWIMNNTNKCLQNQLSNNQKNSTDNNRNKIRFEKTILIKKKF